MSKQLEQIIEKALEKGYANVNGRVKWYGYTGPLESKWQAYYNKDIDTFCLYHWGTCIVSLTNFSTKALVSHIYGQSKSDRDALVKLFNYYGRNDFYVSYRPSTGQFLAQVQFVGKDKLEELVI